MEVIRTQMLSIVASADPRLRAALLEVADEFEAEAARLECDTDQQCDPQ
jgi:hypothetical protein